MRDKTFSVGREEHDGYQQSIHRPDGIHMSLLSQTATARFQVKANYLIQV